MGLWFRFVQDEMVATCPSHLGQPQMIGTQNPPPAAQWWAQVSITGTWNLFDPYKPACVLLSWQQPLNWLPPCLWAAPDVILLGTTVPMDGGGGLVVQWSLPTNPSLFPPGQTLIGCGQACQMDTTMPMLASATSYFFRIYSQN